MNTPNDDSRSARTEKEFNLGEFVTERIAASPAIEVPDPRRFSASDGRTASAPSGHHNRIRVDFHEHGLIEPVMDESQVLLSTSASSSIVTRHQEAASGTLARCNSYGGMDERRKRALLGSSVNAESDYVKIQERNENKRIDHSTTDWQTFSHILKGNIGTGLLALPAAVMNAGIILGPIALLLMGIIATHCMVLLVDVANHLCKKKNLGCLNYAEAAEVAVGQYTKKKHVIQAAGIIVNIFLIITQFGFCCVYFVFMADSLNQVFCLAFNVTLSQRVWIAILFLPLMLLSWIRNLEDLSPFSLIANLCIFFSLGVIFYEEIHSFFTSGDERAAVLQPPIPPAKHSLTYFGSVTTIALFFGGVVYAFEGIGMVLPLENKMKTPSHAKPVIYGAMTIVTILYTVFGTIGYIVYGNNIQSSITLNLKSDNIGAATVFIIVKLYFAYAIFASFLLQFYVPMDFLEPAFFDLVKLDRLTYRFPRHYKKLQSLVKLTFRSALVLLTAVIAIAVPDLGDLISLIGALASSALAFIFPVLLEMITFWPEKNSRKWLWWLSWPVWVTKDCLIMLLGIFGLIFGTYASIANIVKNIGTPSNDTCSTLFPHN